MLHLIAQSLQDQLHCHYTLLALELEVSLKSRHSPINHSKGIAIHVSLVIGVKHVVNNHGNPSSRLLFMRE